MNASERPEQERADAQVLSLIAEGNVHEARAAALGAHGAGIFGFLIGVLGDVDLSSAVYAHICKQIATELETFDGRSSLRAWLYGLGRRELRDRRLRRQRIARAAETLDPVVSTSRPAGLSERVAILRGTLTEEERELLILRVDRRFTWEELAFTEVDAGRTPSGLAGEVRRLKGTLAEVIRRLTPAAS